MSRSHALLFLRIGIVTAAVLGPGTGADRAFADDLVARGAYLATAADCSACHTAPGGEAFAGGLGIDTPIGKIVSTNITPSQTHGIGAYTRDQFAHALREGVRADGSNLYPAMPYTAYSKITDADIDALYAYFMQGVKPVEQSAPATALPFPFNIRMSMMGWNLLFLNTRRFEPVAGKSDAWNRGAYLAEALEHCSTCHTPRNFLMAETDTKSLTGTSLGTWFAPNITSSKDAGLGGWSDDELAAYLSKGFNHHAQAGGPMLEAIDKSLSKLTATDIMALVAYVRDIPSGSDSAAPAQAIQPGAPAPELREGLQDTAQDGPHLYEAYCATCHQVSGAGSRGLPALVGNAAFRLPVADNVSMVILSGVWPETRQGMPGFAHELSDQQVATLVNTLFQHFGNPAVQTSAQRIAELRSGGAPSPLIWMARAGMGAAGLVLVGLIGGIWWLRNRRGRVVAGNRRQ